jgi:hypothetical protein
MLANFLGVLPILTPPLCALAFIMCSKSNLIGKHPSLCQIISCLFLRQSCSNCSDWPGTHYVYTSFLFQDFPPFLPSMFVCFYCLKCVTFGEQIDLAFSNTIWESLPFIWSVSPLTFSIIIDMIRLLLLAIMYHPYCSLYVLYFFLQTPFSIFS